MQKAIHVCEMGGIIAYPTEAVFGLGCIPIYEHSVRRILRLKRRSIRKGLILVAANVGQLDEFVDFSKVKNLKVIYGGSVKIENCSKILTAFFMVSQSD